MKCIGTIGRYFNGPLYKSSYIKESSLNLAKKSDIVLFSLPITKDEAIIDELFLKLDGLFISGDEEVNPFLFGQDPIDNRGKFDLLQDDVELIYIERAIKNNIPLLVTGRGALLLNIYFGGNLYRDLEKELGTEVYHKGEEGSTFHFVELEKSFLKDVFKEEKIVVPSNHRQGIKKLGSGMKVTGRSLDDLAEVIEPDSNEKYLGLQFNLEDMEMEMAVKILKEFFEGGHYE